MVALVAMAFIDYMNQAFDGTLLPKRLWRVYAVILTGNILSFLFLDTAVFTRFLPFYLLVLLPMFISLLPPLIQRRRSFHPEQRIIAFSSLLFLGGALLEMLILRWVPPFRNVNGVLTAMFLNMAVYLHMIAMAMQWHRREQALEKAQREERLLMDANESLDRLNRLKNEQLSVLSHEMRTPLTIISGYAQMSALRLREEVQALNDIPADMDTIAGEAMRLERLVSQLLRLEHRILTGESSFPPGDVIQSCVEVYQPLMEKNRNALTLDIAENLPDVPIDPDALTQVLMNLLTNANRHTHSGKIHVAAHRNEGGVRIAVDDNGEGIVPEVLPHIFERYVHGSTGGTGIGLVLCRELVEAAGGRCGAESIPGEFTRVWIWLPAADTLTEDKA